MSQTSAGPPHVTHDAHHGGPQGRIAFHHPAYGLAVGLVAHHLLDLGRADAGGVQPNAGAKLGDDFAHGPHVRALVPLAVALQHLGGRVGFVSHVHGRVEAAAEELGQTQVDDHGSVGVVFHLEVEKR